MTSIHRQHQFGHTPMLRLPGRIVVVDNLVARGRLIRELCRAMRCAATHIALIDEAAALLARGGVAAAIVDLDRFGWRALAEIAALAPALPVLIAIEPPTAGTPDVSAAIASLGLKQARVVPRPLTTRLLRGFLADVGVLAARRRASM